MEEADEADEGDDEANSWRWTETHSLLDLCKSVDWDLFVIRLFHSNCCSNLASPSEPNWLGWLIQFEGNLNLETMASLNHSHLSSIPFCLSKKQENPKNSIRWMHHLAQLALGHLV
ncbi:hypothetical protein BpHYR1_041381 [Brachionus plicatilis]|uniref:Uncharacterized protein n=1 Tax=Brachionus plicatilis TaxID=10195 RepID=A0A3M7SLR2_BRAPC|nr:hypothetical protein BpHYR1_041381 [Brachionus plicatilis]